MGERLRIGLAGLAVTVTCLVLVAPGLAGGGTSAPQGDAAAGRTLYVESCSSCHGMDAEGRTGVAPSLVGVGAAAADFQLSTGRMPMADPRAQPVRGPSAFDAAQRADLVAYVGSLGGPPVPQIDAASGRLSEGRDVFAQSCAGCHSSTGAGGVITGASVPALQRASALQVAEAVRTGPYLMPSFSAGQISDAQLASVARFVLSTRTPDDRGGAGIGHVGPIPEGLVIWLVGMVAVLGVSRLLGERT
jgi:ubiquinol-cytochrome c reductase cytochrome c subunit